MSNLTCGQQALRQYVRQLVEEYRPSALNDLGTAPSEEALTPLLLRLAEALERDPTVTTDLVTGSDVRTALPRPRSGSIPVPLPIMDEAPRLGLRGLLDRLVRGWRGSSAAYPEPQHELDVTARRYLDWKEGTAVAPGSVVSLPSERVLKGSRSGFEAAQHEADVGEVEPGLGRFEQALIVARKATTAGHPGEAPFDDPATRQDNEASLSCRAFDDLDDPGQ